jgi:MoaA/NifB/PqqE/SkfB family radical SAM enzyme
MEAAVITTYRCNARCKMCSSWQHPSRPKEEISPEIMDKLPGGFTRLNITGGEPALRGDLDRIVDVLYPKTKTLEISTNGYFTDRIVDVIRDRKDIKVRVSIEGLPELNDEIRGIKNGFDHGLRTLLRLKDLGAKDIGFAIVISDRNAGDLVDFFHLAKYLGVEFATSTLHNAFQFWKGDNEIRDQEHVRQQIAQLVEELLKCRRPKMWFRGYLNSGLMQRACGNKRLLPCGAGTDFLFLDPWGDVYACNVRDDLKMGNLVESDFDELWDSQRAQEIRAKVKICPQNCWMVGSAVPAMRRDFPRIAAWVLMNKLRVSLGKPVKFPKEICDPVEQAQDEPFDASYEDSGSRYSSDKYINR